MFVLLTERLPLFGFAAKGRAARNTGFAAKDLFLCYHYRLLLCATGLPRSALRAQQ
jgi:hypothetical protein